MKVTLSLDDEVLARARELAAQRGTSLNQLIRDYLQEFAAVSSDEVLAELEDIWTRSSGDSDCRGWTREELHARSDIR